MSAPFRLSKGGLVDRNRTIKFSFDGKSYEGYPGDTIASALIANGVHMVARSFKYHRPRGIVGAGSDDPAALVQIGRDATATDPNTRVTETEIFDGLVARAQNVWPSLRFDVGALNDLFWKWLSAGFYYKTFMGFPGWMFYEHRIRKAAGLGVAPAGADPDHYQSFNRHVDVLVAGGGAAGLMAALGAARSGARVILCEETAHLGGSLLALDPMTNRIDGLSPQAWVKSMADELAKHPEVTVLTRTVAFGYYAHKLADRITEAGLPALVVECDGETATLGDGTAGTTLRTSRFEALRAMGGRRSAAQVAAYDWDGDPTPYVALMSSYGSRTEPLVE